MKFHWINWNFSAKKFQLVLRNYAEEKATLGPMIDPYASVIPQPKYIIQAPFEEIPPKDEILMK